MSVNQKKVMAGMENFLIDAIVKAKQKEVKSEKQVIRAGVFVLVCIAVITGYLFIQWNIYIAHPSPLSQLIADPILLLLMFFLGVSYVHLQNKKYKFEKAEKDFDKLKEDMIDRASEIWSTPESWSNRAELYHKLKVEHDINLFHK